MLVDATMVGSVSLKVSVNVQRDSVGKAVRINGQHLTKVPDKCIEYTTHNTQFVPCFKKLLDINTPLLVID